MNDDDIKWGVFWTDLLDSVIFSDIEPEAVNQFLKQLAQKKIVFPDGRIGTPSLSTLRRKLNAYKSGGFKALARNHRSDFGKSRTISAEVVAKAIELKKDQPSRSHKIINRFLDDLYGITIPRSTLYRYLKDNDATKVKLGTVSTKVRKRWSRDTTHDLWVGDFEDGPYVLHDGHIVPTYLCAFIDCFSRYILQARYYLRENLDILVDLLIRAFAVHGAPLGLYLDLAKVFQSLGLKAACSLLNIRIAHRAKGDPPGGGIIERFFLTAQSQFEAEVRAGDILTLDRLNRTFSAWLSVEYHQSVHSETHQTPHDRYHAGLGPIRLVDMNQFLAAFLVRVNRTVNKTFSDIRLDNRFYKVDPRLRGDRVQVRYDPFSSDFDSVEVYSLKTSRYLGSGKLHQRESGDFGPPAARLKPKHNYLDLIVRQHERQLADQSKGIDYRNVVSLRPWPFHEFAKSFAHLLGLKAGIAAFSAHELETLKKFYNRHRALDKSLLKQAFEKAHHKAVPYVLHELKRLLSHKEE
jgi:transposase InsO family protein